MYLGSCNLQHFPKLNTTWAYFCSLVCLFLFGNFFRPLTYFTHFLKLFFRYNESFKAWFTVFKFKFSSVFLPLKLLSVGFSDLWKRFFCIVCWIFWDSLGAIFSSCFLLREFTKLTNWELPKLNIMTWFSTVIGLASSSQPCRTIYVSFTFTIIWALNCSRVGIVCSIYDFGLTIVRSNYYNRLTIV